MDIVIVSPTPTHPIDFGNRKRIHRVAKDLQDRGYRIHFVLYTLEDPWRHNFPTDAYDEMREAWDEFHVVIPTVPFHQRSSGDDHTIDEWWDVSLEKFLWWYLRSRNFDAILVNYVYLSRALTLAPPGTMRILDTHDKFGGRRELLAQLGLPKEFFHLTEAGEAEGIQRADLVLAIKDEEESYFDGLGAKNTMTLPFSDPLRERVAVPNHADEGFLTIGMIGGRNNINRVSAERFLKLMVPRIFTTGAPIRIILAGTMCHDLEAFASKFCVEVIGPVDDVSEFYDQIDVAVVPMEISTGQKIKLGEALSFGVSVISHAHAFEGYTPTHPMHSLNSIPEICEACIGIAFEQDQLADLRKASVSAVRLQELRVNGASNALADIIRTVPTATIVVKAETMLASPRMGAFVAAQLEFLRLFYRPELVLLLDKDGEQDAIMKALRSTNSYLNSVRVAKITCLEAPSLNAEFFKERCVKMLWPVQRNYVEEGALKDWSGLFLYVPDFEVPDKHRPNTIDLHFSTPWTEIIQITTMHAGIVNNQRSMAIRLHNPLKTVFKKKTCAVILYDGRTPLSVFGAIDAYLSRKDDDIEVRVIVANKIILPTLKKSRFTFAPISECSSIEDAGVKWIVDLASGDTSLNAIRNELRTLGAPIFVSRAAVRGKDGPCLLGSSYFDLFNWLDGSRESTISDLADFDPAAGTFNYLKEFTAMQATDVTIEGITT